MAEAREPPFGHEPPGVEARRVLRVVFGLGALVAVALVAIYFSLTRLVMPEHAQLRTQRAMVPPVPRLQTQPGEDLATLRAQKAALLSGYAWSDPSHHFARIPIERAMAIYAQQHKSGSGAPTVGRQPAAASSGGRR